MYKVGLDKNVPVWMEMVVLCSPDGEWLKWGNNKTFLNSYFPLKAIWSILPVKILVLHLGSFSDDIAIWLHHVDIFMLLSLCYDLYNMRL